MNRAMINEYSMKFKNARNNLIIVIVLTTVNIVLALLDANLYMLFSAPSAQLSFGFGQVWSNEYQNNAFLIAGIAVSFAIIAAYFTCWLLANKHRVLLLVACILFVIDSLIFLGLILYVGMSGDFLIEIAIILWILYCMLNGAVAWYKLRGISAEEFNAVLQNINVTEQRILDEVNNPSTDEIEDTDLDKED